MLIQGLSGLVDPDSDTSLEYQPVKSDKGRASGGVDGKLRGGGVRIGAVFDDEDHQTQRRVIDPYSDLVVFTFVYTEENLDIAGAYQDLRSRYRPADLDTSRKSKTAGQGHQTYDFQ